VVDDSSEVVPLLVTVGKHGVGECVADDFAERDVSSLTRLVGKIKEVPVIVGSESSRFGRECRPLDRVDKRLCEFGDPIDTRRGFFGDDVLSSLIGNETT